MSNDEFDLLHLEVIVTVLKSINLYQGKIATT